jgi:hypothetical protein
MPAAAIGRRKVTGGAEGLGDDLKDTHIEGSVPQLQPTQAVDGSSPASKPAPGAGGAGGGQGSRIDGGTSGIGGAGASGLHAKRAL